MRAITLWQPWASLVAEGVKTIETRPAPYPWTRAIGERIAIHAGVRAPCDKEHGLTTGAPPVEIGDYLYWYAGGETPPCYAWKHKDGPYLGALPRGAIVATCVLADVLPMLAERSYNKHLWVTDDHLWIADEATSQATGHPGVDEPVQEAWQCDSERPYGSFVANRHALILADVERLDVPVPAVGHQGWWEWTP